MGRTLDIVKVAQCPRCKSAKIERSAEYPDGEFRTVCGVCALPTSGFASFKP